MTRPFVRGLNSLAAYALFIAVSGQPLTVVTWNIRYDQPKDNEDRWELRKEALAKEVTDRAPQLIGLQEVLVGQAEFLDARWPRFRRFGVGRDDGATSGEFSPVYYDTTVFALLQGSTVWLSETPDRPGLGWDATCNRVATFAILRNKTTSDSLWVVNTHWDHEGKEARWRSAQLIHARLAPVLARGKRVIFMGDLNVVRHKKPVRFLREHLADSCPRRQQGKGTFNGFKRRNGCFKRIDYVWLSPGNWEVGTYDVPHPRVSGRQVSDHFPVVVSLQPR